MTESPATYNLGYEDTVFAKRAKAAKVRETDQREPVRSRSSPFLQTDWRSSYQLILPYVNVKC